MEILKQDKSFSKEDMKKKVLECGEHDFMHLLSHGTRYATKKSLAQGWYIQNN